MVLLKSDTYGITVLNFQALVQESLYSGWQQLCRPFSCLIFTDNNNEEYICFHGLP